MKGFHLVYLVLLILIWVSPLAAIPSLPLHDCIFQNNRICPVHSHQLCIHELPVNPKKLFFPISVFFTQTIHAIPLVYFPCFPQLFAFCPLLDFGLDFFLPSISPRSFYPSPRSRSPPFSCTAAMGPVAKPSGTVYWTPSPPSRLLPICFGVAGRATSKNLISAKGANPKHLGRRTKTSKVNHNIGFFWNRVYGSPPILIPPNASFYSPRNHSARKGLCQKISEAKACNPPASSKRIKSPK